VLGGGGVPCRPCRPLTTAPRNTEPSPPCRSLPYQHRRDSPNCGQGAKRGPQHDPPNPARVGQPGERLSQERQFVEDHGEILARLAACRRVRRSGSSATEGCARKSLSVCNPNPMVEGRRAKRGRIVRPRAPAAVRTPFVRNAVTPMPIAPLVAPVVAVPAASAAVTHQL